VSAYSGTYGIPIYMAGMENEPQNCSSGYATMNLDATGPNPNEAALAPYLRSALNSAGYSGVKILGYDHNWNIAFKNPNGSIALVVLNDASSSQAFGVDYGGHGFSYTLPANSIATFTWSPSGKAASGQATTAPLGAYWEPPSAGPARARAIPRR
jgi:hypothetical protein